MNVEPPPPLEPTDPEPKAFEPGVLFPDPEEGDEDEIDWTQVA